MIQRPVLDLTWHRLLSFKNTRRLQILSAYSLVIQSIRTFMWQNLRQVFTKMIQNTNQQQYFAKLRLDT